MKDINQKRYKSQCLSVVLLCFLLVVMTGCSSSINSEESSSSVDLKETVKPALMDTTDSGEESYSRALARANQTQNEGDARLIETDPNRAGEKKNYTLMIYMTGSDLEENYGSATEDIEEMIKSGLDFDQTNLILYTGGAKRWNCDISSATNNVIDMSLPEEERTVASTAKNSDMGSPDTLSEFLNYVGEHYPADHYGLIFWDHGGGPVYGYGKDTLYKGDSLLLWEMKKAMEDSVFARKGSYHLDWVGFDACLMASLENALVWKDYADYLVASEEVEAGDGWDYSFLEAMNDKPDTLGLCQTIVDSFKNYYEENRTEMFHPDITLSVMDLSRLKDTVTALNDVTRQMNKDVNSRTYSDIVKAHIGTKTFGLLGDERGSTFDLLDVEDLGKQLKNQYPESCEKLIKAVRSLVVYNTQKVEGSCGVSMYFPGENKELYDSLKDQKVEDMFVSDEFRAFTENYANRWTQTSDTDWKVGELREEGDEFLLKLTEDQADNLADASYTVLLNEGKGQYSRALARIKVEPDRNNILHIPKDPNIVFVKDTNIPCSFVEEEVRNGRKTYSSMGMTFGMDISPEGSVPVITKIEDKAGKLSVNTVSYSSDYPLESGKNYVNIQDYTVAYQYYYPLSPMNDEDGNPMPYYDWGFNNTSYSVTELSLLNNDRIEFEYGKTSQAEYPAIMQILLKDVNGQDHASGIYELGQGTTKKEKTIQKKTEKGTMEFLIKDGEACLEKYTGKDEILKIPPSVEGFPVVSLKGYSIDDKAEELKELIIPESVNHMDTFTVYNNKTVESISIPDSLKDYPLVPFHDCASLKTFKISDKNPVFCLIDGVLFSKDKKTLIAYPEGKGRKYTIPDGTREIGVGAFAFSSVEHVVFPDDLAKINTIAFLDCEQLNDLILPEKLEYLGNEAFAMFIGEGPDQKVLKIGSDLAFLGEKAFEGWSIHQYQVDPDNSVLSSEEGLLLSKSGDVLLSCPEYIGNKVEVPEGVTALNSGVFRRLSLSTIFYLPDSLVRMSKYDFPQDIIQESDKEDQVTIICSKGSAAEDFAYKYGFHVEDADYNEAPGGSGYDKVLQVQNGVCRLKVYDKYAVFLSYEGTDQVIPIPEEVDGRPVTEIGDGDNSIVDNSQLDEVYEEISYLNSVSGEVSLTEREKIKLQYGVENLHIPDGVKKINRYALWNVLESGEKVTLDLPKGLDYISAYAFGGMQNEVYGFSISEENEKYSCKDGVLFSKDRKKLVLFPGNVDEESPMIDIENTEESKEYYYKIPEGTEVIGSAAFLDGGKMTNDYGEDIYIHFVCPESLRTIENSAFHGTVLHGIILNEGIKTLGKEAFYFAEITEDTLILPDSLKEIGESAFSHIRTRCFEDQETYGFTHIELPEDLTYIGNEAFFTNDISEDDAVLSEEELHIKSDLEEIEDQAFCGIHIKNFKVDEDNSAFSSVDGLLLDKEGKTLLAVPNGRAGILKIPDQVTAIGPGAFTGCSKLEKIRFPDSIRTISNDAFTEARTDLIFLCGKNTYARSYADLYDFKWEEE